MPEKYYSIVAEDKTGSFYWLARGSDSAKERTEELKQNPDVKVHIVYKGDLENVINAAKEACKK